MGPNGSGKSTLAYVLAGREGYEVTDGAILYRGQEPAGAEARGAGARGHLPGLPVSGRDSRRRQQQLPEVGLNAVRKHRGLPELDAMEFLKLVREQARRARHRRGHAEAGAQCRLLRRREEAQRDPADGDAGAAPGDPRRDRLRPRHRRAQGRRRGHQRAARPGPGDAGDHPLSAPARLCACPTSCMCWPMAASSAPAARSWRCQLEKEGYGRQSANRRARHRTQTDAVLEPLHRPALRRPLRGGRRVVAGQRPALAAAICAHEALGAIPPARRCRRRGSSAGSTRTFSRSPRREFAPAVPAAAIDKSPAAAPVIANGRCPRSCSSMACRQACRIRPGCPRASRLLSLPEAVARDADWLAPLSRRGMTIDDPLAALNLAFMRDGCRAAD